MTWVDYVFFFKKKFKQHCFGMMFFFKKIKLNFDKIIIDS